jgi:predicted MPP superfamily phosphohydrolase
VNEPGSHIAGAGADAADGAGSEELRERLGDALYRVRIVEQTHHAAGASHQGGVLESLARFVDVDRAVRLLLKLVGCWRWGYRNFQAIRVIENTIWLPRLPPPLDGFRLLQLSDLHLDLDLALRPAIEARLREVRYDLAVVTGDFRDTTTEDHAPSVKEVVRLLPALTAPAFAVLGNHDFLEIVPPLERAGLRFLLNEVVTVERGGATLWLAGVDDAYFYKTHDLVRVRNAIPEEGFSILLSHSPEIYRQASSHGFDLMLSGHTHGGQICLPGGVPVVKACDVPRAFVAGPWSFRGMGGYTSRGTGSCGVPVRFFCPPEITLHVLRRARVDGAAPERAHAGVGG